MLQAAEKEKAVRKDAAKPQQAHHQSLPHRHTAKALAGNHKKQTQRRRGQQKPQARRKHGRNASQASARNEGSPPGHGHKCQPDVHGGVPRAFFCNTHFNP